MGIGYLLNEIQVVKVKTTKHVNNFFPHCTKFPVNKGIDVLDWWKIHTKEYPTMSQVARDYLAIPATSTSVERIFSSSRRLISYDRCSLNPETITACMCVKHWIKDERLG
jgi:hypothetical protein